MRLCGPLLTLGLWTTTCFSNPLSARKSTYERQLFHRDVAGGVDLRVFPLGDSITFGSHSTDGNGYRLDLQNLLTTTNNLDYIGSVKSGSMSDNDNEGHPGYTIDEIGGQAGQTMPERPNVVLLMAGTNDIVQNLDLSNAPNRLGNLIDLVVAGCPDAAILVATLTPLADPVREAAREIYNAAIPGVVATRANAGKHVMVVDMSVVPESDLAEPDGIHPDDAGYAVMAQAWYLAMVGAGAKGWIKTPVDGTLQTGSNKQTCNLGSWKESIEIAYGVGRGDGPFVQAWSTPSTIAFGVAESANDVFPTAGGGFTQDWQEIGEIAFGEGVGSGVIFADVNGDGRDDYLWVAEDGSVSAYLNTGSYPNWDYIGIIAAGVGANRSAIRFADVDCDGFADYLVINNDGTVSAWLNLGVSKFPAWNSHGVVFSHSGASQSTLRFADINADGCSDYLLVDEGNGATQAFLNDHKFGSNSIGTIAYGVGTLGSAIQFADINGDGLSDYLSVNSDTGAVSAWLNMGVNHFPNWNSLGEVAFGVPVVGQRVAFANLNTPPYNDLKADYITINDNTGAVSAWLNHGFGDSNGDGVWFADLDGDGKEDYLWVSQGGAVRAFLNTGKFPSWTDLGTIATGLGARDDIIFADVNCDGRADYLVANATTGSVTAYMNLGVASFPAWGAPVEIAYGVGTPGSWVRFADIDGDGCDDYLTLNPDTGALEAWLNTGQFPEWASLGLIATGVGSPGDAIRLVDVNGDWRDDYVIVQDNGYATVYINNRAIGSGLVPLWGPQPALLAGGVGASRGNLRFADVTGDGKSDYLVVNSKTGAVDAYINQGAGGTSQPGDGVRFADMNGDAKADYLWVDMNGAVSLYQNLGPSGWPAWNVQGLIANGVGATRESVLFADVTCDKRADYLVVGENGAVTAYYNTGQFPSWGSPVLIATGVGAPREAIRFADINGDGCDDYLIVAENGAVTAYFNMGADKFPAWQSSIVVAEGVGASRADIQFADMNGDGLADYLVVDRVNGAVHAWLNGGPNPSGGAWIWHDQGEIALGVGANGFAINFADVDGDRNADYLEIDPATAAVVAWINDCGSLVDNPGTPKQQGPVGPLSANSTCLDLEGKCPDQDCGNLTFYLESYMWDATDTTTYFQNWINSDPNSTNFVQDFAQPLGIQSSFKCSITTPCNTPDCISFGNEGESLPNTASPYEILVSIANLNQYLFNFFQAFKDSEIHFDELQVAFTETFWPSNPPSNLLMSEILNGIEAIVGILAALTGNVEVAAFSELVKGVIAGVGIAVGQTAADQTLSHLASLESFGNAWLEAAFANISQANSDLMSTGRSGNVKMVDLFDGGAWLDYRNIPILNSDISKPMISKTQIDQIVFLQLTASLLNYAWSQQQTFIMSFPMTEDEFKNNIAPAGNNDSNLKMYYKGRGYFFQSMIPLQHNGIGEYFPYSQNPPGWDGLNMYGFTTHDIIISSAESYNAGGFRYNSSDGIEAILTKQDWSSLFTDSGAVVGVFTIPQCEIYANQATIPEFFSWLDPPNVQLGFSSIGDAPIPKPPAFCYCANIVDSRVNGTKFSDVVQLYDWVGKWC